MFLRQIHDADLGQYAYLIGCPQTGEAIVIDPLRDVARYQSIAREEGLRLTAVAETHIHSDFISGARELMEHHDAIAYISAEDGTSWAQDHDQARRLHDGDVFSIGRIRFQALSTPGHAVEHLSYLVTDEGDGADEAFALLTGDFLLVGDVGRPDAQGAAPQETGAQQLYHSLQRLRDLPGHLQILPGHGAGSLCAKSVRDTPFTTLGYEKKYNPALHLALLGEEAAFVDFLLGGHTEPPAYYATMKQINQQGPALLGEIPAPPEIPLETLARWQEEDPSLVVADTRSSRSAFAGGHWPGSLFLPATGNFATLSSTFLRAEDSLVLLTSSEEEAAGLNRRLLCLGFDHVRAWFSVDRLAEMPPEKLARIPAWNYSQLPGQLRQQPDTLVLDVRNAEERAAIHLAGSCHIPHTSLPTRLGEVPAGQPLIIHCQGGGRAISTASWLQRHGHEVAYLNESIKKAPPELLGSSQLT